jgi:hypothetical protein
MFAKLAKTRSHTALLLALLSAVGAGSAQQQTPAKFHLQEASIAGIRRAILARQITSVGLVQSLLTPKSKVARLN